VGKTLKDNYGKRACNGHGYTGEVNKVSFAEFVFQKENQVFGSSENTSENNFKQ
jgi:hypothetical protein